MQHLLSKKQHAQESVNVLAIKVSVFQPTEYSMKHLISSFVLVATLAPLAQAAGPASPVTANVTFTTLYKYRGIDQFGGKRRNLAPAIQGGFDYIKNGFYVGNWNSSQGNGGVGSEIDLYGGYKFNITKDLGLDAGLLQYIYAGDTKTNTTELYGALSYDIFSLKYSLTVSGDYFALGHEANKNGRGTSYFDFSTNYEVIKNLTLNGHLGFTWLPSGIRNATPVKNYIDYKLGATYDLGSGFSAAAALAGGTQNKAWQDTTKPRLILSVTKSL
jgi:uncharacterized protein (TIGR02001 family)